MQREQSTSERSPKQAEKTNDQYPGITVYVDGLELDVPKLYNAALRALLKGVAEVRVIFRDGERTHFSTIPLMSLHDQLTQTFTEFLEAFNADLKNKLTEDAKQRQGLS